MSNTQRTGQRGGARKAGTVPVSISEDEAFPVYFVRFPDDPVTAATGPFMPNAELSDADAADLRRVRAEYAAWQARLREIP